MLKGGTGQWAGQVEERLEVAARAAAFRAYADLRARQAFSVNDGTTLESWHLPRAFVRLSDETLQLTVGRAWIGLGPAGPLNPFELAPSLEMTDLAAERAGFPIIAAQLALGTLSGAKFYAASLSGGAAAGTEWFTHLAGFDGGLVLGRAGRDRNLAGCWLKGDLGIGLDLALALHFPDDFSTPGASLTAGIDYSLGGVVLRVAFHHDSRGGAEPYNYEETPSGWFHGRLYLQGGLAYQVDEFFALALDAFANLDDASLVLIPAVRWTVVDGLTAEGYPVIPLGHGEFGRDRLGDAGLALRLTAKF
jgi:hypothetical protein